MKKKFKENKCKKYWDNTQVRTGYLHVLHKVTCVLHMTSTIPANYP